ncbi:ABC transporter ATP-binding protein [Candidatus Bipolaricaulota bacterium]
MIQFEAATKTYNPQGVPVHALRDVSLSIEEGDYAAVMGPSGSGKSTFLTVLGAMNPPTSGRVVIDEIDVYSLGHERQADFRHEYIGFVFQQLHLLPYLSSIENVLLTMAIARCPKAEKYRLAREALDQVGLAGMERRMAGELSGGEKGRVAVARAIVNRPPMLLADEPTGNLDQATSTQVLDLLRTLHDAKQTVVMVTHDEHAAAYADHVIHILDGRIVNGQGAITP